MAKKGRTKPTPASSPPPKPASPAPPQSASPAVPDEKAPIWKSGLVIYGGLALGLIALLLVLVSNTPSTSTRSTERVVNPLRDDTPPPIQETLRKATDLAACRGVIEQANQWLADHPERKPPPLDTAVWQQLRVGAGDIQDAAHPRFTLLDAHYLELSLLLAEAARSLDVERLPPAERAGAAFDWVCRQVRLQEASTEFPPLAVLRRGWGGAVERAVVFCALVQHLRLHGCLVDIPQAKDQATRIWLAGALADGQVYLFEPRLGVPLRLPNGAILTMQELREQPELLKQFDVTDQAYDVTTQQALAATVQPAGFLAGLTPRMALLHDWLQPPLRLAVNPGRLAQEFQPLRGSNPRFYDFTMLLRLFYPPEYGGIDRPDQQGLTRQRRFDRSLIDGRAVPVLLRDLPEDSMYGQRLFELFEQPFLRFYLDGQYPRERMLRGRLDDAVAGFVEYLEQARTRQARVDNQPGLEESVRQWLTAMARAEAELTARPAQRQATLQQLEQLWKQSEAVQLLILAKTGQALSAQADYGLALAKHEQAERAQVAEAWSVAAERWRKHRNDYPATHPEALLHQARALTALGQTEAALAILDHPPAPLDPWNRAAFLVRARWLRQQNRP